MHIRRNRLLRSVQLVLCCTLILTTAIRADAAANLVVEETAGAVKVKFGNQWQSPDVGMTLDLPATVSTGADGSIKLRQDATLISVASNTAIELFEGPESGATLQRVVQNQGSAFYDIAPRESNKLRVETPYLVAVIKGTQFNVTQRARHHDLDRRLRHRLLVSALDAAFLKACGYDYGQGYWYSAALSAPALLAWVMKFNTAAVREFPRKAL